MHRLAVLLALCFFACAAGARATVPVVTLLGEIRVVGESIYLSDLLPTQASPDLRAAAAKILIGAAPPPGSSMTLTGERIEALLPGQSSWPEMTIPAQVIIHRSGRLVTRNEVVAAIRAALRYSDVPGGTELAPENVHFSASVMVSAVDAKLEVRRMDFDAGLNQARFLLASAADPRALPFLVTAQLRSEPLKDTSGIATDQILVTGQPAVGARIASVEPVSARTVPGRRLALAGGRLSLVHSRPVQSGEILLIEPGKPASLHVSSGTMQMFLEVVPLEPGALHETVRVRIPGNGRILRGQVIAPGRLEAQF
jgi:hypothetical protein